MGFQNAQTMNLGIAIAATKFFYFGPFYDGDKIRGVQIHGATNGFQFVANLNVAIATFLGVSVPGPDNSFDSFRLGRQRFDSGVVASGFPTVPVFIGIDLPVDVSFPLFHRVSEGATWLGVAIENNSGAGFEGYVAVDFDSVTIPKSARRLAVTAGDGGDGGSSTG